MSFSGQPIQVLFGSSGLFRVRMSVRQPNADRPMGKEWMALIKEGQATF